LTLDNENFISACNKIKNNSNSDQVILSGIRFEKEWYQVPSKMERHRKFECSDNIAILISEIETSIKMRLTDEQRKFILKKSMKSFRTKKLRGYLARNGGKELVHIETPYRILQRHFQNGDQF